jgi:hypothetical protein
VLKGRLRVEGSETRLRELEDGVVVWRRQDGCGWRAVSDAREVRAPRSHVRAAGEAGRMTGGWMSWYSGYY